MGTRTFQGGAFRVRIGGISSRELGMSSGNGGILCSEIGEISCTGIGGIVSWPWFWVWGQFRVSVFFPWPFSPTSTLACLAASCVIAMSMAAVECGVDLLVTSWLL